MSDEVDQFAPYFTSIRVDPGADQDLMQGIHRLRFDVYCKECGFLPAAQYPDGRETDEHDASAAHFCAFDRRQTLAGYVRLVPADARGRFPFQQHCPDLFGERSLPDAQQAAEISRLMVRQHYRRRRGDTVTGVTIESEPPPPGVERRNDSPQIMLSMFRQMYAHSLDNGVRYWYAAMERSLARALVRLGFSFEAIGPETDYYGPVAPYLADLRKLEQAVGATKPELLRWMQARPFAAADART